MHIALVARAANPAGPHAALGATSVPCPGNISPRQIHSRRLVPIDVRQALHQCVATALNALAQLRSHKNSHDT